MTAMHLSAKTFRILLAASLLSALLLPAAQGQTLPAICKPNPGATRDCSSMLPAPYVYIAGTCSTSGSYESAGDANAVWESASLSGIQQCPGFQYSETGWVSQSSPMCASGPCAGGYPQFTVSCGGATYQVPLLFPTNGTEVSNWLIKSVEYYTVAPSCGTHHPQYFWGAVRRDRSQFCPRGYVSSAGYCYLHSGRLDPPKNLGGQCPTCGNPISPGSGNKYQKESDYVGAGAYPLKFERHYNSLLRNANLDDGFYASGQYQANFGGDAFRRLATKQGKIGFTYAPGSADRRESLFWSSVGLDMIGANWRHTYQRAIRYLPNATTGVNSAHAYRQDGRVFSFTESAGAFHAHADIADKLLKLGSGHWRFTIDATGEIETYDPDGRLLDIRSRSGIVHTLQYDTDGRLASVTDSFGNVLLIGYAHPVGHSSAEQQIVSITAPGGQLFQYGYGTQGRLTSVTYPDLTVRQYQYGNATYPRALTAILDEAGVTFATFGYDANGQANSSQHAGGAGQVSVSYFDTLDYATGNATVLDALGVSRTYTFTPVMGVAKVSSISQPGVSGGTVQQTFSYDANGNITRQKDFNGNSTCYAYNAARNLELVRVEGFAPAIGSCPGSLSSYVPTPGTRERKIVTTWHATFRLPTSITEAHRTTSFTHDAAGNVLTRTVTDTPVVPNVSRTSTYHVQLLRPRADGRRSAHRRIRRHDLHVLHLHHGLPVRPAPHHHERARPHHYLQLVQRPRPAHADHRCERTS